MQACEEAAPTRGLLVCAELAIDSPAMRLKRIVATLLLFAVCQALAAPTPDPLAGTIAKGAYANAFFGFTIEVPKPWKNSVVTDWMAIGDPGERLQIKATALAFKKQQGILLIALPLRAGTREMPILFLDTEWGVPKGNKPPAFSEMPDEWLYIRAIPIVGDAAAARSAELKKIQLDATTSSVAEAPRVVDRIALSELTTVKDYSQSQHVYRTVLLAIRNGHVLSFELGGKSIDKVKQRAAETLATLRFEVAPAP